MMKFNEGTGKFAKFKNWFFSGRIKKSLKEEAYISVLSKEYDDGEILKEGK